MRAAVLAACITLLCVLNVWGSPAGSMPYSDVEKMLTRLDQELTHAEKYKQRRQHRIDSLAHLATAHRDYTTMGELARKYTSFNNDSALVAYSRAYTAALAANQDSLATLYRIRRAALLPLGGFMSQGEKEYLAIDTTSMSTNDLCEYYSNGRQMYSYLSSFYNAFPEAHLRYDSLAMDAQLKLLSHLHPDSPLYLLNNGERSYLLGNYAQAQALLQKLLVIVPENNNIYARAAHMLSSIAAKLHRDNDHIYFLALSAISDIKGATLEITSLQDLGASMHSYGRVDRAHRYLYHALRNAVECHAETRMLAVSEAVPLIQSVHEAELAASRRRIYLVMIVMAILLVVLLVSLYLRWVHIQKMNRLQEHLQQTNHVKEVYMSQFLNLCSVYMDKLNQFCSLAERKISTGNVDELYRLTKSGKFIENQSKDFYEVYDNAFIHIYPHFVEKVNELLLPECRFTLAEGELLNNDLRILSLIRLGITESGRIAQILNYSINTVYAYRNRLRNRAIDRENFEAAIASL